jgi:hypothetical protein
MIKRLYFTLALCLLAPGVAVGGTPASEPVIQLGAQQTVQPSATLTATVSHQSSSPNACTGPSPDPQAATTGFTYAAFCIDFTQPTLPSNWMNTSNCLDNSPGYLLYFTTYQFSNFNCSWIKHEIDPTTGQYALHIHWEVSSCPEQYSQTGNIDGRCNITGGTSPAVDCHSGCGGPYNYFGQGWIEMTSRITTNPTVPSPQYNIPVGQWTAYFGHDYTGNGSNGVEDDLWEYDFWNYPGCWGGSGTTNFGPLSNDAANPCFGSTSGAAMIDPTQYHRGAMRITGDGTNIGYTGYWDGVVTGHYTRANPVPQSGSYNGALQFWGNPLQCFAGGNKLCNNAPITAVYQCPSVSGIDSSKTCVTTSIAMGNAATSSSRNQQCYDNQNMFITGVPNVPGVNGMHIGVCSVNNTNPDTQMELQDTPWQGGSYSGSGGMWNPKIQQDEWIKSIQFWTCPGMNPTINPPNTYCNGTVVAGAP